MNSKNKICGSRDVIEKLLIEHEKNENSYFVFPTDISLNAWTDHLLKIEKSGNAIALERFTAWDKFKSESIKSQKQDKKSIPSTLRKLFAASILEENKRKFFFKSLVNPNYSKSSSFFADWIASLLPQLKSWKEHFDARLVQQMDDEDSDLVFLYERYKVFLDENKLFDPAWEKPPFDDDGKMWFILYPQVLLDFEEYRELLESSSNVTLVSVPEEAKETPVQVFSNTREEIHALALYIRKLCTGEQALSFQNVAVSVPQIKDIAPYIDREFSLYSIPYKMRAAKKLSEYPAGRLFSLIINCLQSDFSFESLRSLLLDKTFPWSDQVAIDQLIQFGVQHNCLCSYRKDGILFDVWEDAFSREKGEERSKNLYRSLKKAMKLFLSAKTFNEVRVSYFTFKNMFFSKDDFSEQTDRIMSRCISELDALIQLEIEYKKASLCAHPFIFYSSCLDEREYLAQTDDVGVTVFPYKLASSAPFDIHIIIGASQNDLSIINTPLSFLAHEKRKKLGIVETTVSSYYITLYNMQSAYPVYFSCSEKTFGAWSLPHNDLKSIPKKIDLKDDAWNNEKQFYRHSLKKMPFVHDIQKKGFDTWIEPFFFDTVCSKKDAVCSVLYNKIKEKVLDPKTGLFRISATTLKGFYTCPLQWLFKRIIMVEDSSLEAKLMDSVWIGDVYHEIIRRVLNQIKAMKNCIYVEEGHIPKEYRSFIKNNLDDVIDGFPSSCGLKKAISPLTLHMLQMQKDAYMQRLCVFFDSFCAFFVGSSVSATEKALRFIPQGKNWYFDGRIDCCIDYIGNECIEDGKFIIDFKTGSMPRFEDCLKTESFSMLDFQLALYVKLYEENYTKGKASIQGAGFFSIHKAKPSVIVGALSLKNAARTQWYPSKKKQVFRELCNEEGVCFDDSLDYLEMAADVCASIIKDEKADFFTNPHKRGCVPILDSHGGIEKWEKVPFETCVACPFKSMCRTTYTISPGDKN